LLRLHSSYQHTNVALSVPPLKRDVSIGLLIASRLPDCDGRFVQRSRTCSPQLG